MYKNLVDGCLPIRGINFLATAMYVYNNIHSKCHTNIKFEKNERIDGPDLRNSNEYRPSCSRTSIGQKSITSYGIKIFNNIPEEIRNMKNPASFKATLKIHLKNDEFISSCFSGNFLKSISRYT